MMAFAFIDPKELNHTNNVHKHQTINATNITKALGKNIKIFRQKRPILAFQNSF